jgi:hypothetical protein
VSAASPHLPGPRHAKPYLCDEYVFCVMGGGLTRDEETMIRGGQRDTVGEYRLCLPVRHRDRVAGERLALAQLGGTAWREFLLWVRRVISVTAAAATSVTRLISSLVQMRGSWSMTHSVPTAWPSAVISGTPR